MPEHQRVVGVGAGLSELADAVILRRRTRLGRGRLNDRLRLLHFLRFDLWQGDVGLVWRRWRLLYPLDRLLFNLGPLWWCSLRLLHGRSDGDVLVLHCRRTAFHWRKCHGDGGNHVDGRRLAGGPPCKRRYESYMRGKDDEGGQDPAGRTALFRQMQRWRVHCPAAVASSPTRASLRYPASRKLFITSMSWPKLSVLSARTKIVSSL